MAIKAIDLVENNDGEKTWRGYKFTRNAIVTSPVEQSGRVDDAARIFEAINDTGVPDIGDSHPSVAQSVVKRIFCTSIEPNILTLRIEYETPDPNFQIKTLGLTDISMESSLVQTETSRKWGTGSELPIEPLIYTYQIGEQHPQDPFLPGGGRNNLGSTLLVDGTIPIVPLFIPAMILTYRKLVEGTSESELEALNKQYQGAVNVPTWRGYDARTWLCVGINWRVSEYNKNFFVELRFQYRVDTFSPEIIFTNSYNGKPPPDVFSQAPAAYRRVRVQPEEDFADLISALGM